MPNSNQTTLIPLSEQDRSITERERKQVEEYWKSSGFGLSRLDKASKFELERAEQAEKAERASLTSMAKQAQHRETLRSRLVLPRWRKKT
jgi:hypothetical protein